MTQKVPFHYPLILAGITLFIVTLMVIGAEAVLTDDVDLTPTVDIASFGQNNSAVVVNTPETIANTDLPPTLEPTTEPTSAPVVEATEDTASDVPPASTVEATLASVAPTEVASTTDTTQDGTADTLPPPSTDFDLALAEEGEIVFASLCSACHGLDAKGIEGLGKTLVASEFVRTHTNDELLTFVKTGRPIWDAANTTGVDMPPKGGNPALTDDQIVAVINYIRSIDQ